MTLALVVPLAAPPRLIKKLTVIGMIGHTHGVKIANRPPNSPMTNTHQMDCSPSLFASSPFASSPRVTNSKYSGAVHILSSHALKRTRTVSALATVSVNVPAYSSMYSPSPSSMILRCHPCSMVAVRRTLSPITSPFHLMGSTNCACAAKAIKIATIVLINFFIFDVFKL